MTTSLRPLSDSVLETWYRRLLLAYPGDYRRRHATEMLTTLMESAEPGRERPRPADVTDLVLGGLRQRFRVPGHRSLALAAAVLATLTFGAFGAAAGSWAGERTFAALPTGDAAKTLMSRIADGPVEPDASPMGGGPGAPILGASTGLISTPGWRFDQASDRLAAEGWTITRFTSRAPGDVGCAGDLLAVRHKVVLVADECVSESGETLVKAAFFAQRSDAYLPLTAGGAVLGMLAGWLLSAAIAYRMRYLSVLRRAAGSLLVAVGLASAALPVAALLGNAVQLLRHLGDHTNAVYTVHAPLKPYWSFDFGSSWTVPVLALGAAACAAAAVALCLRRSAMYRDQAPLAG
ncbi:hypothetical protein [Micromonospora sp. ATCC 39149]|uniref:Uncharacterized protein n=1 Tax=Micromonospora carbonacea TaxID=47853 RepID=A0A7D5YFL8_9ACTN|nr:hypothetical protein [Micromonospora sp. ATCC 39149]QLJ99115.1 hypothetical protein HZU44_02740 [Micromonospora carbonacea]